MYRAELSKVNVHFSFLHLLSRCYRYNLIFNGAIVHPLRRSLDPTEFKHALNLQGFLVAHTHIFLPGLTCIFSLSS